MYLRRSPANRFLTLYRGESPDSVLRLRDQGIQAKDRWSTNDFPALDWLRLDGLGPEYVTTMGAKLMQCHVNDELRSPFISFSRTKATAFRYAFAIGTQQERTEGLLVTLNIHIVEECTWEGIQSPTWSFGSFVDSVGRSWIYVPGCCFPNIDAIVRPQVVNKFHVRGRRDDEYLVLGDIDPREIYVEEFDYVRPPAENRQRDWRASRV